MSAFLIRRFLPRFSLRTLVMFLLLVTSGTGLWWHWDAWEHVLKFKLGRSETDPFSAHYVRFVGQDERLEVTYFLPIEEVDSLPAGYPLPFRARVYDARSGQELHARSGNVALGEPYDSEGRQSQSTDGRRLRAEAQGKGKVKLVISYISVREVLAEIGPVRRCPEFFLHVPFAFSLAGTRIAVAEGRYTIHIYRRRRPEWWWGVFWLWEFWLTVAFAGLFVWSVVRDRAALAARPGVRV